MFEARELALAYYHKHYGEPTTKPIHVAVSVTHQAVIELDAAYAPTDEHYCFTLIYDQDEVVVRLLNQ